MKPKKHILALAVAAGTALTALSACTPSPDAPQKTPDWRPHTQDVQISSDTLAVKRVENLPDDFILGMDASCVPALEASGVTYNDHSGTERDVYEILSSCGINYIRVRVWNDPHDASGKGYGGGNCDLANAIAIGKRATASGMKLLVDFHYSDFWADPAKQMPPKAWAGMTVEQKTEALYTYTKASLEALAAAGVEVGMVQIGNETNGEMCGESAECADGWKRITDLMSAGSRAVREACPHALVAIHFTNPERVGSYAVYSQKLHQFGVDYDVFASSYYPFWHGTMDNLAQELTHVATTYEKKVMVAETSYAFTSRDTDFFGNTIGAGGSEVEGYPFTLQGQADLVRDVIDTVANRTTGGIGVFYWEGTWISVGGKSYDLNRALWERYGSGWASSAAGSYDPDDAGKWYGGCSVDNQAFFDEHGRATEALKVFALVRRGNNLESTQNESR